MTRTGWGEGGGGIYDQQLNESLSNKIETVQKLH